MLCQDRQTILLNHKARSDRAPQDRLHMSDHSSLHCRLTLVQSLPGVQGSAQPAHERVACPGRVDHFTMALWQTGIPVGRDPDHIIFARTRCLSRVNVAAAKWSTPDDRCDFRSKLRDPNAGLLQGHAGVMGRMAGHGRKREERERLAVVWAVIVSFQRDGSVVKTDACLMICVEGVMDRIVSRQSGTQAGWA
jgi:hypothetical protein